MVCKDLEGVCLGYLKVPRQHSTELTGNYKQIIHDKQQLEIQVGYDQNAILEHYHYVNLISLSYLKLCCMC
jgi:hypothetical protein